MNKKFLSAILFGALMVTSTGTFVSCKDYDDDIAAVQEQVDASKSAISALETQLTSLQSAAAAAQSTADAAKTAAAAAKAAGDEAKAAAEEAKAAAAQAKVDAIADAAAKIEALKVWVAEQGYATKEELAVAIAAINGQIEGIEAGLSNLTDYVLGLEEQLNVLSATTLSNIVALQEDLEAQKAAIEALMNSTTDEALALQLQDVMVLISEIQNNYGQSIGNLEARLNDLDEILAGKFESQDTFIAQLSQVVATLVDDVDKNKTSIEELWAEINGEGANSIRSQVGQLANLISGIQGELATLHVVVKTRLTSLLFAPTTYVDGIEAIPFVTLQYLPWGDLKANTAEGSHAVQPELVSISDNSTEAYYYVSPSYVDLTSIAKLNVLVQKDVQNITSRAATADIEATMGEVVGGKMKVNFKKNATASFGSTGNKFSIMALQAELTKEEGEDAAALVTSDWARIYENHVRPYIHNANVVKENAEAAHYYSYATIHSVYGKVVAEDAVCDTDGKFIAKELVYSTPADLLDFVEVCDKDGNTIAYADYNMAFEFALMTYNLQDSKEGKTDQAKFAKIEGSTITSQSYNGIAYNADAIGREPMIQAVLKDVTNGNVVDVRYFKIKWIAKDEQTSLGELGSFENDFACGKNVYYGGVVGTEAINVKVYTAMNVSKEYFHANYEHSPYLYASLEDLKAGEYDAALGLFTRVQAEGSTTTYNYQWSYQTGITEDEYDAGKKVVTAYGFFYNKNNKAEKYYFTLTDEITIPQMGITGYVESQWNKTPVAMDGTKIFQVNPALTTDAVYGSTKFYDCQLISSMLAGYNNSKVAPKDLTIDDITNIVTTDTWFEFDASRIAEVLGEGWSVSTDGTKLLKGTQIAAVIEGTIIRLYENPTSEYKYQWGHQNKQHGQPTEAAQALLDKMVPVKLVGQNCANIEKVLDMYLVHFIDPLKMVINQEDTVLKDLISGGSSVDVSKAVQIFEKFGLKRGVVYLDENNNLVKNNELVTWYNVQSVTWDIANAKTNLKVDGNNIAIDGENIAHDWSAVKGHYRLTINKDATELTFENLSGSHIQQEIKVAVPVYVQTKWNPALADPTTATVILTIKPGDYE